MGLIINPETNLYLKELVEKGKLEAKKEAVLNLHRELQLPPEKIAKVLKVSEEFVRETLKEAQKK